MVLVFHFFRDPQSTLTHSLRNRLIFKHGAVNITKENIDNKGKRYLKDIFTTLIDAKWRWTLAIFVTNFIGTWTIFACFWFAMAYAKGDIEYYEKWLQAVDKDAYEMKFPRTPCVRHLYSFTSAFLFSIETQHTIGAYMFHEWGISESLQVFSNKLQVCIL